MKRISWAKALLMLTFICSTSLQGAVIESDSVQTLSSIYTDTSTMNLPFSQIPGFFVCPLQVPGEILSAFGEERTGYTHEGIDIRAEEGTPVFAIADGTVIKAAPDSKGVEYGGGHIIIIDFGDGIEGRYMHLSGYGVKTGDQVKAGQVIGFTGSSGDSTTPLLHFEYRVNGVLMNPAFIFEINGMIKDEEISETSYSGINTGYSSSLVNTYSESFFVIQR